MPQTELRVFRTGKGDVPIVEWLDELEAKFPKAHKKMIAALTELARDGNQVRRPLADYLRDGIYELRVRLSKINYRILYGFRDRHIAILTHGFTKKDIVPSAHIELATEMMRLVKSDPNKYTAEF